MAIVSTDIKFKYSAPSATAGNTVAGSANTSLGKYISTTEITDATLNNLFDDISGAENAALDTKYRCIFVHNAHASLTLQNAVVWIYSQVSGGANCEIGVDPTAASAIDSSTQQAVVVADEGTAPGGITFSAPTTKASGLSLGNIPAGYCRAIWIKRTATNSAALSNDGVTIRVEGETAA